MQGENSGTSGTLTVRAGEGSVSRGQSRTIALLLLTIIAIGLSVSLAAFSFALTPSENDRVTMASVDVAVTEESVTVAHRGGNSFQAEDIHLEINGGQRVIRLDTFTTQPDQNEQFTAGERWTHEVTFTDSQVRVAVVHGPTETVLVENEQTLK